MKRNEFFNGQLCLVGGTIKSKEVSNRSIVKERAEEYGVDSLMNYEALSLITGIEESELQKYKSLSEIEEKVEMLNCTKNQKLKLKALFQVSRRYSKESRGAVKTIKSPEDAYRLVVDDMRFLKKEVFKAIALDTKNQVIDIIDISVGSLSASIVHPREVFKELILRSANAVVFAHNHPSGINLESIEDVSTNKRLLECAELLGIKLLDHIIVGGNSYRSLKEQGLM